MEASIIDLRDKYTKLKNMIGICGKFIGADLLDKNYKPGRQTSYTTIVLILYQTFTFYSIYVSCPHYIPMLKTLITYGIGVQVSVKCIYYTNIGSLALFPFEGIGLKKNLMGTLNRFMS